MRVSTDSLFRAIEALRKRMDRHAEAVYKAEGHVSEFQASMKALQDALEASNDEVVRLAARVKVLEDELASIEFVDEDDNKGLRSWITDGPTGVVNTIFEEVDDAIQSEGRNEVHQEGDLEDR